MSDWLKQLATVVTFGWCYTWVVLAFTMAASSLMSSILGQNIEVTLVYKQLVEFVGSAKTRAIYLIRRDPVGRWLCEHKVVFWTIVTVWTLISTVLKAALIAALFKRLFN